MGEWMAGMAVLGPALWLGLALFIGAGMLMMWC